jgi:hypothetical protein
VLVYRVAISAGNRANKKAKITMKTKTAALFAALGMAVAPIALAPVSHAEVCGAVGGRHVEVGGCSHVVGDVAEGVALANDDDWAAQEAAGQTPCYTPAGVPYYTPGGDPCVP